MTEGQATRRRGKRRLIWPLLLTCVLAASATSIVRAATSPAVPVRGAIADAPHGSAGGVSPVAAAPALAPGGPFGPQIEVILPPPPPPPPAARGGAKKTPQQRIEAAAAAGVTTAAQWCEGKYGATASASSLDGLLAAANAERARFGLGALAWSSSLASSAQSWSDSMAGAYDPANPGSSFTHGQVPSPGGQNIALYGSSPPGAQSSALARAHSGWMASPGHCANILRSSFSAMGAATTQTTDGVVWYTTVNFQ